MLYEANTLRFLVVMLHYKDDSIGLAKVLHSYLRSVAQVSALWASLNDLAISLVEKDGTSAVRTKLHDCSR